MSQELLFVYGTLRQSASSPMDRLMDQHCQFMSTAHLSGQLFELGGYPGAVHLPNSSQRVEGDIFKLHRPRQLWPKLDHYELCSPAFKKPWQFVRKQCSVTDSQGNELRAWVYLYNYKTAGFLQIKSGNYLHYLNNGNDLDQ